MNSDDKFRQAVTRWTDAAAARTEAQNRLTEAEEKQEETKTDLARVLHSVFGSKQVIFDGRSYQTDSRMELSMLVFEGVVVETTPRGKSCKERTNA